MAKKKEKAKKKMELGRYILVARYFGLAVFGLLAIVVITTLVLNLVYLHKAFPGVRVADTGVGGKSVAEVVDILAQKKTTLESAGFTLLAGTQKRVVLPQEIELTYDLEASAARAIALRRSQNLLADFWGPFMAMAQSPQTELILKYNEQKLDSLLESFAATVEQPEKEADVVINGSVVEVVPGSVGQRVDLAKAKSELIENMASLTSGAVELAVGLSEPQVTTAQAEQLAAVVRGVIDRGVVIVYGKKNFSVSNKELASWLRIEKVQTSAVSGMDVWTVAPSGQDGKAVLNLAFNESKIRKFIEDIATKIDRPAASATLAYVGGKITETSKSHAGLVVNVAETVKSIKGQLRTDRDIELAVKVQEPTVSAGAAAGLGIKELVSTGVSDFVTSSRSRIINITTGARKFNGYVIKPNEEFSFDTVLGEVTARTGYVPEMVIKGKTVVPEYGGGLCQVATTCFRAALLAGLPVTERHNHAFVVGYYLWPYGVGFDATIYAPWVDLKFVNNTGNSILIQTHIAGTKLYFDFYGTKDGRTVKLSGASSRYNSYGTRVVGFTRRITKDGKTTSDTFTSFYKPASQFSH